VLTCVLTIPPALRRFTFNLPLHHAYTAKRRATSTATLLWCLRLLHSAVCLLHGLLGFPHPAIARRRMYATSIPRTGARLHCTAGRFLPNGVPFCPGARTKTLDVMLFFLFYLQGVATTSPLRPGHDAASITSNHSGNNRASFASNV
jgi:hypothetical protein